ncbi:hypothetical protein GCM10010464_00340 [Pseudonocardia yunnanensis]|uniref:Uncharacterized protein n=1 Tax=Pseudonocardia yunnanensis TaxID=58107 RepID=A0ABW4FBK8_9PSEU
MIIRLQSAAGANIDAAKRDLEALAQSWGHEVAEAPDDTQSVAEESRNENKAVDPVAVTALVMSIPSAALAVLDLADRIRKRLRAQELIDSAQQLSAQHVTVCVISQSSPVDVANLAPDQLLELLSDEDPPPPAISTADLNLD